MSRINYGSYNAKDDQYAYGVGQTDDAFLGKLIKVDVQDGSTLNWSEDDVYPGEPVFVEAPDATDEDDGVVMSIVTDVKRECSYFLLPDASSFQELARTEVPHKVPLGFHGQFYRNE